MRRNALETQYSTTVQAVYTSYNTKDIWRLPFLFFYLRNIFSTVFSCHFQMISSTHKKMNIKNIITKKERHGITYSHNKFKWFIYVLKEESVKLQCIINITILVMVLYLIARAINQIVISVIFQKNFYKTLIWSSDMK